jgi:thioredoxin 1
MLNYRSEKKAINHLKVYKMLQTNLKHLMTEDEHKKFIEENDNVMVCCGRMGPMCIPVYGIMEELEPKYKHVRFCDMEFTNP